MKPALLLDVDGVLNAFPRQNLRDEALGQYFITHRNGFPLVIDPVWKYWIGTLTAPEGPYELVWATTWETLAPIHIAPLFELPETGVEVIRGFSTLGRFYHGETHKLPAMRQWWETNERPSVWVDDCIYSDARRYIEERNAKGFVTKFVQTNPNTGLVIDDIVRLWDFAHENGWVVDNDPRNLQQ